DSEKHGRALCELFGAYGWTESVFEMLYLANHFLTRGINYFIPHAFSMSYGDKDCPPHFYAEGKNPAFKGYKKLFAYMSEMSEKFSGGMEECDVAVLYHDEAEWSGKPFMPCDNVAKVLTQSQIEFDFVYGDVLSKTSDFDYKFLIVPFCEYLTPETRRKLDALKEKVVYVDKKVSLECLPEYLFNNGVERRITTHCKDLRIYSYLKYGKKIGLLFNESGKKIEFRLNTDKKLYAFDYCANKGFIIYNSDVVLAPAQCVFVAEEKIYDCGYGELMQSAENITEFDVFLRDNEETRFKHYKKTRLPFDVNGKNELPNFCGEIEYRFLIKGQGGVLEVDYDGEYCELTVGDNMQTSIGGKAFFVLPVSSKDYIVSLKIANTLSYKIFDDLSKYSYNSAACIYSVKQVIRDKTCR
ncbi:MAG: hypothetical protein J6Y43_07190, partial [Clostridia bacterium]|nr:hypothetical protein [Clostridia bacterium]